MQQIRRQVIAAGISLAFMLPFNMCSATELVGTTVPPYPEGAKNEVSACIANTLGHDRVCDYSIWVLRIEDRLNVYVGKAVQKSVSKKARWLVTDRMPYPEIEKNQEVAIAQCEKDGKPDGAIVAIVVRTETEWFDSVLNAYRVNLNTGRFERIPTTGIRCANAGWGI